MTLFDALHLTGAQSAALCGAGGKTTLLYALAEQARRENRRVLVTTSTHILLPEETDTLRFYDSPQPDAFDSICIPGQISVVGTPCGDKKITGIASMTVDAAMQAADLFVYEADGSHRLPLKCHNSTEPAIWFGTEAVLCVLGLSACGRPAQQVCHRWQLDPLFAAHPDKPIDTDDLVRLALECRAAAGYPHRFSVCFNQCDTGEQLHFARSAAQQLAVHGIPCAASCFSGPVPDIAAL